MAENDEASGSDAADTPYVPSGLRRSTFTPPPRAAAQAAAAPENGAAPSEPAQNTPAQDTPAPHEAATQAAPQTTPQAEGQQAAEAAPAEAVPPEAAPAEPPVRAPEPGEPEPVTQPTQQSPTQQSPTQHTPTQQTPGEELPDRPTRKSLADDDLVRKLSTEAATPGATLDAIEELQAQLLLRQEEARQFGEWESGMRAIGTPEALDSIAQAIPEFTGVIPIITPEQNAAYLAGAAVPPQADEPSQPLPHAATEPPSAHFMDPEAYPPPRLEERVEGTPLEEMNLSDHLVFQPPWMREQASEEPVAQDVPVAPEGEDVQEVQGVQDAPDALDAQDVFDTPIVAEATDVAEAPDIAEAPDVAEEPITPEAAEVPEVPAEPVMPAEPAPLDEAPTTGTDEFTGIAEEPGIAGTAEEVVPSTETPEVAIAPEAPTVYDLINPPAPDGAPLTPASESFFDQLLSGDVVDPAEASAASFPLLDATEPGESVTTASQPIVLPTVEEEPDDDVDDVDRASRVLSETGELSDQGAVPGATESAGEQVAVGEPVSGEVAVPPVEPLASPRVPTGEQLLITGELPKRPVFGLELSGLEPTPLEHRVGKAARMFWLWFATNASVVSIGFGAALLGLGMSLRQAILAAFIGVAISFLPLGLGTLAGKWSGQPTIVVSRATFGLVGNVVPAALALLTRLFWGAVLLWLLAVCTARILVGASLSGPLNEMQLTLVVVAVGFVLAFLVAFLGYPLFARLQLILSIVSAVLILGLFVVTWNAIDIRAALSIGDGPWILVITGVVLVFSFIGLVWANGSGDIARYQQSGSSGASASLWASFGATLPAFLLIAYGALLAASSPSLLSGLRTIPIDTIAGLIPTWYPVPLIAATALSLLAGVALSLYSGGFSLQAVGVRLDRQWAVVIVGVAVFAIAIVMALSDAGFADVFRDLATSIAVPIAAWAGIFAAEMMIRRRHFDTGSLLRPGGVYPDFNWINFAMLFVASGLGFAFTSATVSWLSWQGYGFALFGVPLDGPVGASDLGVLVALAIGLLTPLAAGVSAVRRQESASR